MPHCPSCNSVVPENSASCPVCGTPLFARSLSLLPVGTLLAQRYSVGKLLGQGGFGITYKGADRELKRPVAIKEFFLEHSTRKGTELVPPGTLSPKEYSDALDRFEQEAQHLKGICHPFLLSFLDFVRENNTAYLITELVSGDTLDVRIRKQGVFSEQEGLSILQKMLQALQYLHEKSLLHRDIKPSNVVLREGTDPVLLDFGSVRPFVPGKTQSMTRLISPDYAAPEQYSPNARFGPRLDIFCLGACAYHMFRGKPPEPSASRMHQKKPLEPIPGLSPAVMNWVQTCTQINANFRYASAAEALVEIEKILHGVPMRGEMVRVDRPAGGERAFSIGKYAVTVEEYVDFLNRAGVPLEGVKNGRLLVELGKEDCPVLVSGGRFRCAPGTENHPVTMVSWWGALAYCHWLNEKEGFAACCDENGVLLDGSGLPTRKVSEVEGYRLPTSEEWMFAARGGSKDTGPTNFAGSEKLSEVGWFSGNSNGSTHPVGEKKPNELGLFDMCGNTWEWCQDSHPELESLRLNHGGSWSNHEKRCTITFQYHNAPELCYNDLGFRLARTLPEGS
ncbi:MAG TPA: bifunctional serine/threonine-protein kinase/formylglycine-generating enzyme family protein [Thermotogota bacterium]|nr:bifunctional serine/threonine-protein kinase/formylglycine-generating enzyme family protein [Thermotogota bacterium]